MARVLALVGLILVMGSRAEATQIWFVPADNLEVKGVVKQPDFPHIFDEPSKWPVGLSHTQVIMFRKAFLARVDSGRLTRILEFVSRHQLQIGVTVPFLPVEGCGSGLEGMSSFRQISADARMMRTRDIPLAYVVMDEPLFFGRDYKGKNACRLSLSQVVAGIVHSVRLFRAAYPRLKFVLVEPQQSLPGGPSELGEFLDEYRASLGEYPDSMRLDVQWRRNWREELPRLIREATARGVPIGVIYNAAGIRHDDVAWIEQAKSNIIAFESAIRVPLDHIVFESWASSPSHDLPETDPFSLTGLLKWYVERER